MRLKIRVLLMTFVLMLSAGSLWAGGTGRGLRDPVVARAAEARPVLVLSGCRGGEQGGENGGVEQAWHRGTFTRNAARMRGGNAR